MGVSLGILAFGGAGFAGANLATAATVGALGLGVGSAYTSNRAAKEAGAQARDDAQRQQSAMEALLKKPPAMPTADSAAIDKAKQASIVEQMRRSGRASTFLSGATNNDPLGGG